jgi:hypothetical protein
VLATSALVTVGTTQPAFAANVTVSFNPTSARNGTVVTVVVKTSGNASCVKTTATGSNPLASQGNNTWQGTFTAGAGNGTQTVSASAWNDSACTTGLITGMGTYILDNTNPTISGAATPAANANNWNNTNVAVNWTCTDNSGGSGIASCTPTTNLTTEGANQSATGTATDNAGNSASTTVSGISIDKTPPSLLGVPTTSPNGAGWYNANVTIHWSCTDALSGVSGSCPGDTTISSEGTNLTSSTSVGDKAGNTTNATSTPAVKIDKSAPTTTATVPSWSNGSVSITLNTSDNLSGVASTKYIIDGGSTQTGTQINTQLAEGTHMLQFWSTDNAGNVEATKTAQINVDTTPPTITHTLFPVANAAGWNNSNVTVTFTCADALSGIASCSGPASVTANGAGQQRTGTATDNVGNSTSDTATVNLDKMPPTISSSRSSSPNANGWYKSDVTVTFTCNDDLSGISTCTNPITLNADGANQSATGTATDLASNSTSTTNSGINIDKTAPTISGAATTTPNANGWYSGNVVIHWTCNDNLSGVVTCPADTTITGAGSGLTVSATVTDKAGNTTTTTSPAVNIDRVAPVTTSNAPSTWQNADVPVHLNAVDDYSGIASTSYRVNDGGVQSGPDLVISTEGTTTIEFWSTDKAGNIETHKFATVLLDKTKPTIGATRTPAANSYGWSNTNVGVTFACADSASGVQSCTSPVTLSTEGANQSATGTATDNAGNSASTTVAGISIDKTAPSLSGAPTTSPNGEGWYNSDVTIHWACGDSLSGIDGSCPSDATITGEGTTLTASASVNDKAGNTTNATSSPAVKIDRTAPITSSAPPAWNNTDVTVALTANDALSGVAATFWSLDGGATQAGLSVPVTTEGDHTIAFWSVDKAGNVETTKTVHVKIDKTSPTISDAHAPSANLNGWNNTDVTVTFTCADALSGISSCTSPQTVTAEGKNQTVTGRAVDNAGNTANDPATVSIDTTKPTISSSRSDTANVNGWYNHDVTVTYTCTDSLSGIDACTAPRTLGEGAGQTATGTATDAAGNSSSATDAPINVDETLPTITGTPTTPPNADGWYNGDVTIHWTCSDTLSGIDSCPGDSTITGAGTGLTAMASVSDLAGNTTLGASTAVNIDRVAPITTSDAPAGWQTSDATVKLTAIDDLSGVQATYYSLNHGSTRAGTSVSIATEGVNLLEYWSVDAAGNVETTQSVTVLVDTSAPTITHTATPAANAKGWTNAPVSVTFWCGDAVSGVASCTGNTNFTSEGINQIANGGATDYAGNTASDSATINIDKTPPSIIGSPTPGPNTNGWNNTDVTVSFQCSDDLSGVATCSGPSTLNEGANQSMPGSATDNADNTASTTVSGINIDETPPIISGAATSSPNADGWYNSNVDIEWNCSDALSGIAGTCPATSTITGEGDNLTASASISDLAGNSANTAVDHIKIDRHAPSTDASAPSGWVNNGVSVSLDATDNLSGIAATHYILDDGSTQDGNHVDITSEGTHTLEYWSVDVAGNVETHKTATIKIDKTAPTITHTQSPEANSAGWNNSDVTVTFSCEDALSGIASCTAPQTITSEDQDQHATGSAVDNAGNTADDNASVSIDKTKPTISSSLSDTANGNGWFNSDVTATFTCHDTLSGIAGCSDPVTFGEGTNQSTIGTAVDAAGNSDSTTVSGINVDETPPAISGKATADANDNGWYNTDVTVHWTCSDDRSGLDGACPDDSTVGGEGRNLQTSASIADLAGNASTATVDDLRIDRTPPKTTSDAPSGWQSSDVTVTLAANDGLSGVATTNYVLDGTPSTGTSVAIHGNGVHTLEFWSVDKADNAEAHNKELVEIDTAPPTIGHGLSPAPNAHGWNNTPVTVTFNCADQPGLSGIASCTDPQVVSTEGGGQLVNGTAVDNAGNSTGDTATVNLDETPPTITGATDSAPNADGWYKNDVKVSFSCSDDRSGIQSCTSPVPVHEGQHQSVQGTAVDAADNTAHAGVSGLNVDETPPTISGKATTDPNANGWYNGDVMVHWSCADALSGLASCSPDSTIIGEGSGLFASGTAVDNADNQASATVPGIHIDRTAPSTDASAPSGWVNANVTVALAATDNLSGVAATHYILDNDTTQTGNQVVISSEGVHTLTYWSVDNAGNEEAHQTITVRIDKSNPTITDHQTPAANVNGWNNTDVTITFDCADQPTLSGLASCEAPHTVTTEGQAQAVLGTATDHAGNTATDTATMNIDKTKPNISGGPDRPANGNGWYNADVKITFTCIDALSGIAANGCTPPKTLGEGANQTVTGTATDAAGNSSNATVSGINVDETPPAITSSEAPANGNGWYNHDVAVHWTCADALSGIDGTCPADSVITGEGANLSAFASAADHAGNQSTANVAGIHIDHTAPSTSSNAPSGWQKNPVTVDLSATDNLSGIAQTDYAVDNGATQVGTSLTITSNGTHTIKFWSIDKADNAEAAHTATVQVDTSVPMISGAATTSPNGNGWYNHSIAVHFTCTDSVSGIASCPSDVPLTSSGANLSATGTTTDNAGNPASTTVAGINIDLVPPTALITGVTDGATYKLGAVPTPSCTSVDQVGLSGSAGCTGVLTSGTGIGVGTFSYTATATDRAGNITTQTIHYTIKYSFSGFRQPINDTAHQTGQLTSIFKAGSTVPVKFDLESADGSSVHSATPPQWLTPVKGSPLSAAVDENLYGAAATTGTTYRTDSGDGQYIYNWSTQGLTPGYYYRIGVRLDDGSTYIVNIGLR